MTKPAVVANFEEKVAVGSNGICSSNSDEKVKLPEGIAKALITKECLIKRVEALAKEISSSYKEVFAVIVLKGAKVVFNDLKKFLEQNNIKVDSDEINLASYSGTESTGKVKVDQDITKDIAGKDVLIIEDIVDTGLTLNYLKDYLLKEKKAKTVKIFALLDKPSRRNVDIDIDYLGFDIPNEFIVGYGIDYEQKYRELPYIASIKE